MLPYLKLIRYKNLLMITLTILLTKFSFLHPTFDPTKESIIIFLLFLISTLSFTASGYVFNDLYDVKADKINKPSKLLIGNTIPRGNAVRFLIVLLCIGLITGFWVCFKIQKVINILYLVVPLLSVFLYTLWLKRIALLGNVMIALCAFWLFPLIYAFESKNLVSTTFLEAIGKSLDEAYLLTILIVYGIFSFFITFIREIIKDIEDIDGDYNMRMRTLPIIFGIKRSRNFVIGLTFLFSLFLVISIRILFEEGWIIFGLYTIIFILIPTVYFIYQLWYAETKREFASLSSSLKLIMFFGILSLTFFKYL